MSNNLNNDLQETRNLVNWLGVGIVTENKQSNTHEVAISLKSVFPLMDGEIGSTAIVESRESQAGEAKQTSTVMKSSSQFALWKGFDPNRITSPDVRVGHEVLVYQFADNKQLYWTTFGIGVERARLETVQYAFNASPRTDENVPYSEEDYYTLTISPNLGFISLVTSKANGEVTTYKLVIETKTGRVALADDFNNLFFLDSKEKTWIMQNGDNSILTLAKKNIMMSCEDTISLNATNSIVMQTKDLIIVSEHAVWNSNQIDVTCPTTNITGNINQIGNLGVQGDMSCTGGGSGGGKISTSGNVEAQGDVIAGGISLRKHTHDVINHSTTTAPK